MESEKKKLLEDESLFGLRRSDSLVFTIYTSYASTVKLSKSIIINSYYVVASDGMK